MKKRRKRRDDKTYRVTGSVKGIGEIEHFTSAVSWQQAIKQTALFLGEKYPWLRIFIEDADAEIITGL